MNDPEELPYDELPIPGAPANLKEPILEHIRNHLPEPLSVVKPLLVSYPADPEVLILAALAALLEERPDQSLAYQKRFKRRYVPSHALHLLHALALAQKKLWPQAARIMDQYFFRNIGISSWPYYLPCGDVLKSWVRRWLKAIESENDRLLAPREKAPRKPSPHAPDKAKRSKIGATGEPPAQAVQAAQHEEAVAATLPALTRLSAPIPVSFDLPGAETFVVTPEVSNEDPAWFRLRSQFAHLSLLQGFDELLCLPLLHDVNTYWYQVETVRKVLKQFRGRVLLADEVGLGKTIEAGMVLKEYMLRGMAKKVLVLTPATMVGQWIEEMQTKFGIGFASSYDSLLRSDPERFWSQPRVIASIAAARRAEHIETLRRQVYDLVIVDEAHHLKNRATNNWKLVDALQKRFLLLLSATPVQNSLVELYNLLTLLKPGIFKTEKEFRSTYVTAGKPRVPANRDRMRDLMRDVMIRNTRSQVDVRLPPRTAVTLQLDPSVEEASCYQELSRLIQQVHKGDGSHHRLALRHLLSAAGSSPAAASTAIHRFIASNAVDGPWLDVHDRYSALAAGSKEIALIDLLKRNPNEKKMVFVHHRETLSRLDGLMRGEGVSFARFDGSMSGPDKDRAVERFRTEVALLLCTESGGEGRNLQFCNTLINFDLPWNPMAIEQRIGRLHRIGQERQVFIFNLVVRNTLEEYILRILDEKINMFELVVGEIDAIFGEMTDEQEFAEMVFSAWVGTTEHDRSFAFGELGEKMADAKRQYEAVKVLDENLFGDEFVTA
jgi:superfamily II DNA or RNA helicase